MARHAAPGKPAGIDRPDIKKKCQTVCKPGFVPRVAPGDGHSSGTPVTGRLARPTRAAARKHAWTGTLRRTSRPPPPLFGLAPGGVYRAIPVAGDAVRSYRTLSPLPAPLARQPAVCFLWHFPWGRPRRPLTGTVFPWSPDFPPPTPAKGPKAAIRPSDGALHKRMGGRAQGAHDGAAWPGPQRAPRMRSIRSFIDAIDGGLTRNPSMPSDSALRTMSLSVWTVRKITGVRLSRMSGLERRRARN
jgi:hypothetical protein